MNPKNQKNQKNQNASIPSNQGEASNISSNQGAGPAQPEIAPAATAPAPATATAPAPGSTAPAATAGPARISTDRKAYRSCLSIPRFVTHAEDWRRNAFAGTFSIGFDDAGYVTIDRGPVPAELGKGTTDDDKPLPPVSDDHKTPKDMLLPNGGARITIDAQAFATDSPKMLAGLLIDVLNGLGLKAASPADLAQKNAKKDKANQRKLREQWESKGGLIGALIAQADPDQAIAAEMWTSPNKRSGGIAPLIWTAKRAIADGLKPSDDLIAAYRGALKVDATSKVLAEFATVMGIGAETPAQPATAPATATAPAPAATAQPATV